jgi:hypothetical protein
MSIRHKPKQKIDINQLLISLESPTEEEVEDLNIKLGKYLDKVTEPLNLSFWQSVNYNYWMYTNLLKLTDKKYDSDAEEFIKKIYKIANNGIRNSPKTKLANEKQNEAENNEEVSNESSEEEKENPKPHRWIPNISVPRPVKYVAGGVLALIFVGATFKYVHDDT